VLTNCVGTQQVLELAHTWGVRRFVFLSSLPVIGRPLRLPVGEDHPTAPGTAYHASKLFGEQLVRLAEGRGIEGTSLRLTSVVGAGMPRERIVATFVARALAGDPLEVHGQGTRRQDYVDARDVAACVAAALTSQATGLFNVGAGTAISNHELARLCVEVLSSPSPVLTGGVMDDEEGLDWEVSIERARTQLGYSPAHELASSIRAVVDGLGTDEGGAPDPGLAR
jgi:UDP-glucose 4-epimerase